MTLRALNKDEEVFKAEMERRFPDFFDFKPAPWSDGFNKLETNCAYCAWKAAIEIYGNHENKEPVPGS